jgi:UDPglucose--hexose-1-phosphate uridylyltransferase
VIAFSPRHDLTLAELPLQDVEAVIHTWCDEFVSIAAKADIRYIQIFENKGEIMGCSNPHPHGQIWASNFIPNEIEKEDHHQKDYFEKEGTTLLYDYIIQEMILNDRVVCENEDFVALVPFWAVWPFEVMVVSKRPVENITGFTTLEKRSLAKILKNLTSMYDLLFDTSFPYSAGMHQAPVNDGAKPWWHWHMHFYPPLLRSATIKKFMVGYEMLCGPQRDITPEQAAEQLRNVKVGRDASLCSNNV